MTNQVDPYSNSWNAFLDAYQKLLDENKELKKELQKWQKFQAQQVLESK